MRSLIIAFILMLILGDWQCVSFARKLLFSFVSPNSRKKAKVFLKEQPLLEKLAIKYVKEQVEARERSVKKRKAFKRFYKIYMAEIISLIPQYLPAVLFFFISRTACMWYFIILCIVKAVLVWVFRLQFDAGIIYSKYEY